MILFNPIRHTRLLGVGFVRLHAGIKLSVVDLYCKQSAILKQLKSVKNNVLQTRQPRSEVPCLKNGSVIIKTTTSVSSYLNTLGFEKEIYNII